MPNPSQLPLFKAAVANVRSIEEAISLFKKDLNRKLCLGTDTDLHLATKIYIALYCIWAEALLMRVIYVPYGLNASEIEVVLNGTSIEEKWKLCIEYCVRKSFGKEGGGLPQNLRQKLTQLVDTYVVTPAQFRNKIAHGQWVQAFNNSNTALNSDTSALMEDVDFIEVDRWFLVMSALSRVIEDGTESPDHAFRRDVFGILSALENELARRNSWSIDSKRKLLSHRFRKKSSTTGTPSPDLN